MPYDVDLTPSAMGQLTNAWLAARDKKSLVIAHDRLETELRRDPRLAGKHLSEGLWLRLSYPLRVYYEISDDRQIVTITDTELAE
jgi:mRNA-degrading endonuclease RelE of RelBE toxin-antitoxin system